MSDLKRIAHDLEAEALDYHGHAHDYLVDAAHTLLGAAERIKELETALQAFVDFDNLPLEAKRPDVFQLRLMSASAALERKRDERA